MNSPRSKAIQRVARHRMHAAGAPALSGMEARALSGAASETPVSDAELAQIHRIVSCQTSTDLSYLQPYVVRQGILRRIASANLATADEYLRYLGQQPREIDQLFSELLDNPAGFFHEAATLDALSTGILGTLWQDRRPNDVFRAWVPCCSTGEEVYSVGITTFEMLQGVGSRPAIQIFGTDLNERALETARAAIYRESAVSGLPADRLFRFLKYEDGHYRVCRQLREVCLFARQHLACDPPLSKMDLVVFRNQLSRVVPETQMRILDLLHYSLKPGGVLAIGQAETVDTLLQRFTPANGEPGIYMRRENGRRTRLRPSSLQSSNTAGPPNRAASEGVVIRHSSAEPQMFAGTEEQFRQTADHVETVLEELKHTIEALRVANEEISSSNEELITTNEELMTLREELQASNQELLTVNQEMESRNQAFARAAAEVFASFRNIPVAVVAVDSELRVRRCTISGEGLFSIRKEDAGRPITDLQPKLHVPDLEVLLRQTIADLAVHERDVRGPEDVLYRLSILPYRDGDDRIDGALLSAWPL